MKSETIAFLIDFESVSPTLSVRSYQYFGGKLGTGVHARLGWY
jgi:hypothetical protein